MINEQETELFREWSTVRKGFCPDGIIDEQAYLDSKPKLLFLLKEVNGDRSGSFDLKKFLRSGGRPQTWNNVARWIYGIRHLKTEVPWSEVAQIDDDDRRAELMKSVCIMNLKKSTGGYVTDNVAMQQVATEDKALFKRQFGLYHPDVIIACGSSVSDTFFDIIEEEDPKWLQTSRGINYTKLSGSEVFISFSHPEARIQDSLLYYGLIDTVKEIVYIR